MSTPETMNKALSAQEKPRSLQTMIENSAKELARALPEHMKPERLVRIALTCIRTTPDLAKCTPESFLGALFTSAQLGVEPIAGRAYLLPFNNNRKKPDGSWHTVKEAQFVLGYKGVIDLFYRHASSVALEWGIVHEGDRFEIELGTNAYIKHIPGNYEKPVTGYWALARLRGGGCPFLYMTREECLDHGKKHSKTFDKKKGVFYDSSPWIKDEEAMCLKTVLSQAAKIWPISIELQRALDADESARDIRPGIDNVLDIPSQVNWDEAAEEVKAKTDAAIQSSTENEKANS